MQWNIKHLISVFLFINLLICSFPYEIIVKYKTVTTNIQSRDIQFKASHASIKDIISMGYAPKTLKIIKVNDEDKEALLETLKNDPNIEYAHPNYQAKALIVPNDTSYSTQQPLFISYGAEDAWDITTGSSQVIVAILDTGIDTNHPDLVGRILTQDWKNYISSSIPEDDNGHGTHVAGIIGANGNNGTGVTGLDWNCKLLPIKVLDSSGSGSLSSIVDGMYYAVQKGAKVINLSLGFNGYLEDALQEAIDYVYSQGIIIVVAAGNDDINITTTKLSPVCNDGNANKIFGVASLTSAKVKSWFSNFSDKYVDISAFGSNIYSTSTMDSYDTKNGTSMAAPAVSGIIALLLSLAPNLTPAQVMDYLKDSAENVDALNSSYVGELGAGLAKVKNLLDLYQGTQSSTQSVEQIYQFYNYPNPIDASSYDSASTIFYAEFSKPVSRVNISVYSITGRKAFEININQVASTQLYYSWDLITNSSIRLPSGPYIAIIKANFSGKDINKHHKVLIK